MMKSLVRTVYAFGAFFLAGTCALPALLSAAEEAESATKNAVGIMLLYEERETGTDSYPIRMIITDEFVRSDDGIDNGSYLLYDRNEKVLYSVLPENRRMLVLSEARFDNDLPESLRFDVDVQPDKSAPRIQGRQVYSYSLKAGEQTCQNATVVPGLLDKAVEAIGEVRALLAGRQFRDLENTPEEFRTPCFMANYVYAAGTNLKHGLPIQESNNDGLTRMLVDFDPKFRVDSSLFELPEGYSEFAMP